MLLDGPRLPPASGGPARALVVFLHGYGADGDDLIDLGRSWAPALPHVAFASPHAPEPCGMAPTGRQWFPLTMRDPGEYGRGVQAAGPVLARFLEAERARHGLSAQRLALVGFSQGAMMALHMAFAGAETPAAVVAYSGLLATPPQGGARPPRLLLVHGERDEVIPVDALHGSAQALAQAGVPVRWRQVPGLGHGIDPGGSALGARFLRDAFAAA